MKTPIDRMIDEATGYKPPVKRDLPTEAEREIATKAGDELIWYIDQMYPEMWGTVSKSARTSIKNTVHNRVLTILMNAQPNPAP